MLQTASVLEQGLAVWPQKARRSGLAASLVRALEAAMPAPGSQVWLCPVPVEIVLSRHVDLPGGDRFASDEPEAPAAREVPVEPPDEPVWAAPAVDRPESEPGLGMGVVSSVPEVLALRSAVEVLAGQDPTALPGAVALQRAQDLLGECERLRVLSIQALADVETRQLFSLADAPSMPAWVKAQPVHGVEASEVTLARRLGKARRVAEELSAGRLSTDTASRLTAWLVKARPHLDRPDALIDGLDGEAVLEGVCVRGVRSLLAEQGPPAQDPELVELTAELTAVVAGGGSQAERLEAALVVFAQRCDPVLLGSGLALLMDALLPAEHAGRAERAEQDRGVRLHRDIDRGGGTVGGRLDDELFELLSVAIDAAGATDPANPADTAAWRDGRAAAGDDTLGPQDWPVDAPRPRSTAQRRHDALKRALQALLGSGALGVRGKTAPHIVVTVPIEYAAGLPGALPARTATGGRLTRRQVQDLLCRGVFTRMVLDARHRVVQVSHTQRTATALERLMQHVQTGGVCQGRACGNGPRTGHRLVPHHVELFSQTGSTVQEDTVWICEIDHDHHLHGHGRTLTLKDGRVIGPDGWIRR